VKQPLAANQETDDLPGAKTQRGEEEKDGVIAATDRGAAVTGLEHPVDSCRVRYLGTVESRQFATVGTEAAKSTWSSPF
jgi:hypothetical protein